VETRRLPPNPGDKVYTEEWYCDKDGNENLNGGFGCSLIVDITSQAVLNCSKSNGSPCASVQAIQRHLLRMALSLESAADRRGRRQQQWAVAGGVSESPIRSLEGTWE